MGGTERSDASQFLDCRISLFGNAERDSSLALWILPVTLRVFRTGVPHFLAGGDGSHNGAGATGIT
jgi:hypothetical protein